MASAAIGTVAVTAVLVAGLALYLILIATHLAKISSALDTVYQAVVGITDQVKPAPGVVGAIATDVGAMQGALHGLIALATAAPAPVPAGATSAGGVDAARSRVASARAAARAGAAADAPPPPRRRPPPSRAGGRPNLPPPVHRGP